MPSGCGACGGGAALLGGGAGEYLEAPTEFVQWVEQGLSATPGFLALPQRVGVQDMGPELCDFGPVS